MKIRVEFIGAIDVGPYRKKQEFEIREQTSIRGFLETLHFEKAHLSYIQAVKNGHRCAHTELLENGDSLELMLMVGGG